MAKLKQYLENSWYRGASQDRQTGYAAQYQYGYGVNTRDMKNGVCLAGGLTSELSVPNKFVYFSKQSVLYTVAYNGIIRDMGGNVKADLGFSNEADIVVCERFGDYLFVANDIGGIYQVDVGNWTYTDISALVPDFVPSSFICMLNYANTFLLIGCFERLIKIDLSSGSVVSKVVREFESSYHIVGLSQEGNYLKIYTTDNKDTKIHYAKGTFDVEYTGLVQTISFKGLSIPRNCVASDQGNDYVLFRVEVGEYKLAKISGYNKIDIRWTQSFNGEKIFTASESGYVSPSIYVSDGVLFVNMIDGIWTFTEYNGWLWGGCCEFPTPGNAFVSSLYRLGERLYICLDGFEYESMYFDMSFQPAKYQSNGFIIGRVFDGGCAGLFKKNDQATITYNMPKGTSMELSYRYDRSSFGYNKSNFLSIKKLTDVNNCYDIVVPTTPGIKDTNLLALENNGNILLENGDNIMLEDLMVCPFNKTWNLLEYRFDLSTEDSTKTPILFEHSLTYYDYMRKYR